MKTVLMYFLLIIMLFLLILPPGLRIFMPNKEVEETDEMKDKLVKLMCERNGENLAVDYENNILRQIFYRVPGNKLHEEGDSLENETNEIIKDIYSKSYSNYGESEDVTVFTLIFSTLELNDQSLKNYVQPVEDQKKYYEKLGFKCDINILDI